MNAGHELHHLGGIGDVGLDHRELVAAEPGDVIGVSDTVSDPGRHGL